MVSSIMENPTLSQPPEPDLDWQAFLYLSGEMSPAEIAAFERLLETDQTAREAVAAAVHLVGTVAGTPIPETVPVAALPRISSRKRGLIALAASAAVVLVALSVIGPGGRQSRDDNLAATTRPVHLPDLNAVPISEMLALWNQADRSDHRWPDDEDSDDESPSFTGDEEAEELTVPGWLLAAVASEPDDLLEEN